MKVGQITVQAVPHRDRLREGQRQVGAHADILTPLTGEEEGGLALTRRSESHGDVRIVDSRRGPVGECAAQFLDEGLKRRHVRGDQSGACRF